MTKDKIFELRIEEDDDISGVDQISLVDEPAIEVNWIAFKKEKAHDFHIPDGEDDKYSQILMGLAQDEDELINEGYEIVDIQVIGRDGFATTEPNAPSEWDEPDARVRYKYLLNPAITGQASIIATSRDFCRHLVAKNYVWRVEDMEATTNDFGDSALVWRGGYNCRHVWAKILYKKTGDIVNKASVNKDKIMTGDFPTDAFPDLTVLGYDQPSTVTQKTLDNPSPSTIKNLGLSKEDMAGYKISIDFDDTLSTKRGQELAKRLMNQGDMVYVVTRRYQAASAPVYKVTDELGIPRQRVHFTNGELKWKTLKELGIKTHYDNNANEIKAIKENTDIEGIQFDYVNGLPNFVDPGLWPKGKKKPLEKAVAAPSMFESHSDYPDSVKNNAKAVLKYVDENGWGSCGTDVGKQRANQLANGEALSEDTIRRMYSYLSRHAGDLDSSKGYDDGCGKLMYDAWGGKTALSWAESKVNTFDKQGFEVGVPHYTADGKLYEGPTHKDANGKLMTGAVHTKDSVYLYHKDELPTDKQKMSNQAFVTDSEKHMLVGPAMVPDKMIFRKDKQGNPYYVYFTTETIKMIADKFLKNKYVDNSDSQHDGKVLPDVFVVESWIKEDMTYDKGNKYGFGDLPIGTWFVAIKVNNPEVWAQVKDGKLNGFSVSGFFEEVQQFSKDEMLLFKINEILSKIVE